MRRYCKRECRELWWLLLRPLPRNPGLPGFRVMLRKSGKPDLRRERAARRINESDWVRGGLQPLTQPCLLKVRRCPLPQGERAQQYAMNSRLVRQDAARAPE
jgi:hypothetical protein